MVLDSTVLGGTFTPSLSLGGGVVRNFFLPDRTQHQDLFALPPSSKLAIALGMGTGLPGLPKTNRLARKGEVLPSSPGPA